MNLSLAKSKSKPAAAIIPNAQSGIGEYIVSMNSNEIASAMNAIPMKVLSGFSVIFFIILKFFDSIINF